MDYIKYVNNMKTLMEVEDIKIYRNSKKLVGLKNKAIVWHLINCRKTN